MDKEQQRYQRAQPKVLKKTSNHSKEHKLLQITLGTCRKSLVCGYGLPACPRSLSIAIMLYWWSLSCKFFTNPAQTKMRNWEANKRVFFSLEGLIVGRYWMCAGTGIGAPCCFIFIYLFFLNKCLCTVIDDYRSRYNYTRSILYRLYTVTGPWHRCAVWYVSRYMICI